MKPANDSAIFLRDWIEHDTFTWLMTADILEEYAGASSSGKALRSCCAGQTAVGCSVTATWTIRRRSCARMTSTKSILNVTVGTTKKSTAMIWLA